MVARSSVPKRSLYGIALINARSRVVFPAP
jgi:hypothetical protein